MGWLRWYWDWTGSNVAAMPACGLVAAAFTLAFRKPLGRFWHKHFGARAELDDIKAMAASAHRIAADLFEHHTGSAHPDAPGKDGP